MFVIDFISKRAMKQEEEDDEDDSQMASIKVTDEELYNLEITDLQQSLLRMENASSKVSQRNSSQKSLTDSWNEKNVNAIKSKQRA